MHYVKAVIMLWYTEGLHVWTAGSEAHILVEHSSMSCITACLCSSVQLDARWSPLTCILHLTSTLHNTMGITPACRSVDVYKAIIRLMIMLCFCCHYHV